MQSKTFVDSGLVVETDTKKQEQNTTQRNPNLSKLPLPKILKSKFSGRVGIGNEKKKASQKVKIPSQLPQQPEDDTTEELVSAIDKATYDIPI